MVLKNAISRIHLFLRKEYFDPDIFRALLITSGLLVPLVVSQYFGLALYGSFAAITSQLLLSTKLQTTYPRKAFILVFSLIFISIAPFIGTIVGPHFWLVVITMAIIAGISSLAKELGAHGQTLGLCAVIVFLLSLNGPHDIETGLYRMLATWLGGMWASLIMLFFWPIRPNLPYYTNLALPWEIGGNLAAWLADSPRKSESNDDIQKKEANLRTAINNVLPFLRKKDQEFFLIRRDLLKVVRASSRFGATMLAMYSNLENVRQQKLSGPWKYDLQLCFSCASQAAKAVANILVMGREKDFRHLEKMIKEAQVATNQLQQHLDAKAADLSSSLDLHRIVILLQSAVHYLQDAQLLLNRIREKRKQKQTQSTPMHYPPLSKLLAVSSFFKFKNVPLKHTLRLMILTAISIALFYIFDIPRGYWIALTVMVVLQPDYGTTQQKALQRVTGTTIGAALSTLLLIQLLSPGIYILLISIFCFLFIYLQQRNYTLAVVFVTMMLVAMFEISGNIDWHYATYRLFATSLGGVLAIVGAFLLWPNWERFRVRSILAKGVLANRDLLIQLQHELTAKTGFHARIIADRRKAEVANLSIADSIVRLKLEPGTKKQKLQLAQSIAFENNRLTRELTSFATLLPEFSKETSFPETVTVLEDYTDQLTRYADYIASEKIVTENIIADMPFRAASTIMQLPPHTSFEIDNPQLHVNTLALKEELIHEQINKIAATIYNLKKHVQALNLL
ncbi:FUSC family protein [Adhaeribacter swui]|uniref:FUSC family protein n=1 Tax=Adhaeribacter swui TaxID=2086471 RepID=A0A7G7G5I7_9BACT|nr:FUSC family protein [Adhaeribacter swui]QNF32421.1 FUSC family protein [Adhaeribacter swui]